MIKSPLNFKNDTKNTLQKLYLQTINSYINYIIQLLTRQSIKY